MAMRKLVRSSERRGPVLLLGMLFALGCRAVAPSSTNRPQVPPITSEGDIAGSRSSTIETPGPVGFADGALVGLLRHRASVRWWLPPFLRVDGRSNDALLINHPVSRRLLSRPASAVLGSLPVVCAVRSERRTVRCVGRLLNSGRISLVDGPVRPGASSFWQVEPQEVDAFGNAMEVDGFSVGELIFCAQSSERDESWCFGREPGVLEASIDSPVSFQGALCVGAHVLCREEDADVVCIGRVDSDVSPGVPSDVVEYRAHAGEVVQLGCNGGGDVCAVLEDGVVKCGSWANGAEPFEVVGRTSGSDGMVGVSGSAVCLLDDRELSCMEASHQSLYLCRGDCAEAWDLGSRLESVASDVEDFYLSDGVLCHIRSGQEVTCLVDELAAPDGPWRHTL